MKVIVAIKRVVDHQASISLKADLSGVDTQHVNKVINPFDEIALEEAVRWREAGTVSEVIVVSVGDDAVQENLRQALAMGADRALLLKTEEPAEPLHIARLLKAVVEEEDARLIMLGKQSIDGDNNQTGQMLAALLEWPQATFASKIILTENYATVIREIDTGLETLELKLPAVITADLRLNTPRLVSLPNLMKAKTKPLQVKIAADMGVKLIPMMKTITLELPPKRKTRCVIKDSFHALIADLSEIMP